MALKTITIPEPHQDIFLALLSLSGEAVSELSDVLGIMPSSYNPETLISQVQSELKSITADVAGKILPMLYSLGQLIADGMPVNDLARQIASALKRGSNESLRRAAESREDLEGFLYNLLNNVRFAVAAKAFFLLFSFDQVLQKSTVITDVRPVFRGVDQSEPVAAIITHTLKLEVIHRGEPDEVYISMDSSDLLRVIEVLERAKKKTEALKEILSTTKVRCLEQE